MTKKAVQFALEKDNKVHSLPSRHEYSYSERAKIWFTREENTIMKYEMGRIVDLMERHGNRMSECTRGLESKTRKGAMDKKIAALDGICAVLLEQERQRQEGIQDFGRIRSAYVEMNAVYVRAAVEQGLQDAQYNEEKDEKPYVEKKRLPKRGPGRIQRLLLFKGGSSSPVPSTSQQRF